MELNHDTLFNIVQIITIIGGGGAIVWRLSKMATRFEMIGAQQAIEITSLKAETHELGAAVEKINDVLVAMARQSGRIDRVEDRQLMQGKRLDEQVERFNNWSERVYEERHRQIQARLAKVENGN